MSNVINLVSDSDSDDIPAARPAPCPSLFSRASHPDSPRGPPRAKQSPAKASAGTPRTAGAWASSSSSQAHAAAGSSQSVAGRSGPSAGRGGGGRSSGSQGTQSRSVEDQKTGNVKGKGKAKAREPLSLCTSDEEDSDDLAAPDDVFKRHAPAPPSSSSFPRPSTSSASSKPSQRGWQRRGSSSSSDELSIITASKSQKKAHRASVARLPSQPLQKDPGAARKPRPSLPAHLGSSASALRTPPVAQQKDAATPRARPAPQPSSAPRSAASSTTPKAAPPPLPSTANAGSRPSIGAPAPTPSGSSTSRAPTNPATSSAPKPSSSQPNPHPPSSTQNAVGGSAKKPSHLPPRGAPATNGPSASQQPAAAGPRPSGSSALASAAPAPAAKPSQAAAAVLAPRPRVSAAAPPADDSDSDIEIMASPKKPPPTQQQRQEKQQQQVQQRAAQDPQTAAIERRKGLPGKPAEAAKEKPDVTGTAATIHPEKAPAAASPIASAPAVSRVRSPPPVMARQQERKAAPREGTGSGTRGSAGVNGRAGKEEGGASLGSVREAPLAAAGPPRSSAPPKQAARRPSPPAPLSSRSPTPLQGPDRPSLRAAQVASPPAAPSAAFSAQPNRGSDHMEVDGEGERAEAAQAGKGGEDDGGKSDQGGVSPVRRPPGAQTQVVPDSEDEKGAASSAGVAAQAAPPPSQVIARESLQGAQQPSSRKHIARKSVYTRPPAPPSPSLAQPNKPPLAVNDLPSCAASGPPPPAVPAVAPAPAAIAVVPTPKPAAPADASTSLSQTRSPVAAAGAASRRPRKSAFKSTGGKGPLAPATAASRPASPNSAFPASPAAPAPFRALEAPVPPAELAAVRKRDHLAISVDGVKDGERVGEPALKRAKLAEEVTNAGGQETPLPLGRKLTPTPELSEDVALDGEPAHKRAKVVEEVLMGEEEEASLASTLAAPMEKLSPEEQKRLQERLEQFKNDQRNKLVWERQIAGPSYDFRDEFSTELQDYINRREERFRRKGADEPIRDRYDAAYEEVIAQSYSEFPYGRRPRVRVIPATDLGLHDWASPPFELIYTNRVLYSHDIVPEQAPGCGCVGNCGSPQNAAGCACRLRQAAASADHPIGAPKHSGFAWTRDGTMHADVLKSGNLVMECNSQCGCGPECINRVVGAKKSISVDIVYTGKKGWAVRLPESYETEDGFVYKERVVKKGEPLGIYAGELMRTPDAHLRDDKIYVHTYRSYIYDLDCWQIGHVLKKTNAPAVVDKAAMASHDPSAKSAATRGKKSKDPSTAGTDEPTLEDDTFMANYSIDAFNVGNWTRFANHVCSGWNAAAHPVYVDDADVSRPLWVYIAQRDIHPGEEISICYFSKEDAADIFKAWAVKGRTLRDWQAGAERERKAAGRNMRCYCGHQYCRGIMFRKDGSPMFYE
ncbi:hypothetical protein JCM10213_005260 [Rhodosporidiobolus nylandii]